MFFAASNCASPMRNNTTYPELLTFGGRHAHPCILTAGGKHASADPRRPLPVGHLNPIQCSESVCRRALNILSQLFPWDEVLTHVEGAIHGVLGVDLFGVIPIYEIRIDVRGCHRILHLVYGLCQVGCGRRDNPTDKRRVELYELTEHAQPLAFFLSTHVVRCKVRSRYDTF